MCAYKGIDKIINGPDNSNLKVELRQGIVLLCSAVYHNKGDILKSVYNVFKPLLIESNISDTNISLSYSNIIKLFLYEDNISELLYIELSDKYNTLKNLIELVIKYFQGNDINFDNDDKNYLNLNDKDNNGMTNSEKLGLYIVTYYSRWNILYYKI